MAQDIYIKFKGDATNLNATVSSVDRALRGLDRTSQRASQSLSRIDSSAKRAGISLRAVVGTLAAIGTGVAVRGIVGAYTEFENFRTVLTTFLGSAGAANSELDRMQKLANTLPQDLSDITNAFTIFTRFGLDTSSKSLTAFSNIATANGKSLTQLAEAVADGMTGEFERFKEFGIKVSNESGTFVAKIGNDQVALATTTEDLIDQLVTLGAEGGRFGGAAAANAGTLSQAFSNLRGTVNSASIALMKGMAPALRDVVTNISNFLSENTKLIESIGVGLGQAITVAAKAFVFLIANMDRIVAYAKAGAIVWAAYNVVLIATAIATGGVSAALKVLRGALISTGIGAIIVLLGEGIYQLDKFADSMGGYGAVFAFISSRAKALFAGLRDEFGILAKRFEIFGAILKKVWAGVVANIVGKWADVSSAIGQSINSAAGSIGLDPIFDTMGIQAYASMLDHASSNSQVKIAQLRGELGELEDSSWSAWGALSDAATAAEASVGRGTVIESMTERAAYLKQQSDAASASARKASAALSAENVEIRKLNDEYTKAPTRLAAATSAMEFYQNSSIQQLVALERQYTILEKGMEVLADQGIITEERRASEILRIRSRMATELSALNNQIQMDELRAAGVTNQVILTTYQSSLDNIAAMQQGGVQGAIGLADQMGMIFQSLGAENKKAFQMAKAFNIASAIMNTAVGISKAFAMGGPLGFLTGAAVAAAGYAQVSAIKSQQYSGRALGGPVMGNTSYMVGENGPEIFTPASSGRVTRNDQIGADKPVNITFTINAIDAAGIDQVLMGRRSVIQQIVSDAMVESGQRSRF